MFGGRLPDPGKPPKKQKPFVKDLDMPGIHLEYGHLGREGNTNHHVRTLHFKQREDEFEGKVDEKEAGAKQRELWHDRFVRHTNNKYLRGEVQRRLNKRLEEHEEELNLKRERLAKLYAEEEHLYIWETVDQAQRGGEQKVQEMKLKSQQLQAKNEALRMKTVKEKKLQQYLERSLEVRPAMERKNVEEAKKCQLQQMRENESRREAERELDKFWHDVTMHEITAKMEREEQEAIDQFNRSQGQFDILSKQIAGKKLAEQEQRKIAEEDRLELIKVQEKLRQEELDVQTGIEARKRQLNDDLRNQIEIERALQAQRKKEETALENAYNQLSILELERDKAKVTDASSLIRHEIMLYRNHLHELETEKKLEEEKMHEMLEEYRRNVEAKEDEKKCKEYLAKMKLHREVIEGRAQQIEDKKQQARDMLAKKQEENEILRQAIEINNRLDEEQRREKAIASQKYKNDLNKQIEYGEELKRREQAELERQLALGKKEEEYYHDLIKELCSRKVEFGQNHPFRTVLERYDCHCPEERLKPKY